MSKKVDFQLRVLKKYSVLPVFEGDVPSTLPNQVDGETFAQWSQRVLGVRHTDVSLYMPVTPTGHTHIETIGVNSLAIKRVAQKAYKNGKRIAERFIFDGDKKEESHKNSESSKINADLIYEIMSGAVTNRSPETVEFFKRFSEENKNRDDWRIVFENLVYEYVNILKGQGI